MLDVVPSAIQSASDAQNRHVGFIEGSSPQIAGEIANILRGRLRAAAGILGLSFGLFFAYRLITDSGPGGSDNLTFYFHFLVSVVLIACFGLLCRRCAIRLGVLRIFELIIFGLPVCYFLIYDYKLLTVMVARHYLPNPLAYWVGTVFVYAMFIPNTWRRAAVVIGSICLAPAVLLVYLAFTNSNFATAISSGSGFLVEFSILLSVTFLAATYGTHLINSLRHEAFEAKQLGQYKLLHPIGSGGMGDVYLAEHRLMKRPCAIKLIRPGKATDPHVLARFE
ncbi:MAG TPA: serine/threonine protein kinase, partial [Pirellulales bacterium]